MAEAEEKKGIVISDLHLFAQRSDGAERFSKLKSDLQDCDLLILNGDIFDFRWSTLPSHQDTVAEAIRWLEDLLREFPKCHFYFLLGNHDCLTVFQSALAQLAETQPRFSWHEHLLQLGPHLFLHGDCSTHKMGQEGFERYRRYWIKDHGRSHGFATIAYTLADRIGVTWLIHRALFRGEAVLDRLTYYLDESQANWRETVRYCYFGHTHEPFSGTVREGITYFNTGSTIRGMLFVPASFSLQE